MQRTQNRRRRTFFAFGMVAVLGSGGALAEPVPDVFNCGLAARLFCKEGSPCPHTGIVVIGVLEDGGVTWNGMPVDEKTFSGFLDDAARLDPEFQVTAHVDAAFDVPYGRVAVVVAKIQNSGVLATMCSVPDRDQSNGL